MRTGLLLLTMYLFTTGCTDRAVQPVVVKGKVNIVFQNKVGTDALVLNNTWYKNENGDSFTVMNFKYYISNIKLMDDKGIVFAEPESYHLINQKDAATRSFKINSVPPGNYKSISFLIGVDSARNVEGAQTGALDPANEMFWGWNSGYVMFSLIGQSPQSADTFKFIAYETGGYSGQYNVLQTVKLDLPQTIKTDASNTPTIDFTADILSFFKSPTTISFGTLPVVNTPGADAKLISENYARMFSISYAGQ